MIDCTVQWLNMLNKDLQQKIVDRVSNVVKTEEDVRDHEVPPATKVSVETQTDAQPESEEPGGSHQREEPASSVGSQQRKGREEKKKDINADDTAPDKKPAALDCYGQDISGNETDSVLKKLKNCFKDGCHSEWAGFYNEGFPALPQSQHMMWQTQFRQTEKPHGDPWYPDTEENFMKEYINRHYDESVLSVLEELRRGATYSCSDPRIHNKERVSVTKLSNTAAERHKEDFENIHEDINDYLSTHGCIPYCVVLQLLAMRYLGAGLLDSDIIDKDYPYRSSKSCSCMF